MALLRNVKTQQFEEVPDSDAGKALRSGVYDLTPGEIQVQDPEDGQISTIPTSKAAQAYELGLTTPSRAQTAASEETALAENRAAHFDDPLIAGIAGFNRGVTLGGSDLLTAAAGKAMGVDLAGAAQTTKEVNPVSSTVGEVGGAIAGSLATGGYGTAKGAAQVAEGLGEGLQLAGSTVQLGKAAKLAQVGEAALQGAAEGAIQGAGMGLSEAVLSKNPDDVAEKVMMHALEGAKFGGFIGAGGGALGAYGVPLAESAAIKGKELADLAGANAGKLLGKVGKKFIKDPDAAASFELALQDPDILRAAASLGPKELEARSAAAAKEVNANFKESNQFGTELGESIKNMAGTSKVEYQKALSEANGDAQVGMQAIKAKKDMQYDLARDAASNLSAEPSSGHLSAAIDDAMSLARKFEQSGQSAERNIAKQLQERIQYIVPDSKLLALKGQDFKNALNASLNGETELQGTKLLEEFTGDLLKSYNTGLRTGSSKLVGENYNALRNLDKTASSIYEKIPDTVVGQAFIDARKYNQVYQDVNRAVFKNGSLRSSLSNPANFDSLNTLLDNVADVAPQLKNLATMANGAKKANELKTLYQSLSKDGRMDPSIIEPFVREMGGDISKLKDMRILNDLQKEFTANPAMTAQDKLLRIKTALKQDTEPMLKDMAETNRRMDILGKVAGGSTKDSGWNGTDWIVHAFLGSKGMAAYKGAKTLINDPYTALQATSKLVNMYDKMSSIIATAGRSVAKVAASSKPIQIIVSSNRSTSPADVKKAKDTIALLNDPQTFQEVMGHKTSTLSSQPGVQTAINTQTAKTAQFLQSKLPQVPEVPIGGKPLEPNAYETAKFARYLNAVEDPLGSVHRIAAGRGSPEEIETLKTIYPNTFSDLQNSVMNGIVESGAELPYSKRVALSQMFDLNLDSTLNADFIQKMQTNFATSASPNGGDGRPQGSQDKTPRFKRRADAMVASDLQKLTNEEYK